MKNKTKILTALGLIVGLGIAGYTAASFASGMSRDHSCDRSEHGQGMMDGGHGMMGGAKHGGAQRMMQMMDRYDANNDGALTIDEITAERAKRFKSFDKNADGMLDLQEYQGLWMDAMRERMVDRFQSHDNDGDGKISEEDFTNKFTRMMSWMDRNGDGKVDSDDRMGPRRHQGSN